MRLRGRDLRAGLAGDDVAALHDELVRLGYQVPESERARKLFGVQTAQAVAMFQSGHGLLNTAVVDDRTAVALEQAAAALPTVVVRLVEPPPEPPEPPEPTMPVTVTATPPPAVPTGQRSVSGHLFTDRGAPAAGVTLRGYLRGFGGIATPFGEATTGPDGSYTMDAALPAGLSRLDVRAVGADGTEVPLVGSDLRVDTDEPVDLVVPAGRLPAPASEYARLTTDIRPHLGGGALAEAREDDERRDLSLLHEATGWDARLIALGATAQRLAARVGLEPQVLYGLLRAGLPSDPVQLARIGRAGIGHALRKSVDAGVVELDEGQVAAAQAALDTFGRTTRRKLAVSGTASSYGAMLAASGLDREAQDRFDEIFSTHTGDAGRLWQRAHDAGLPADQLRLTAQLGVLTLNSARLVADLRARAGTAGGLGVSLVADKLYQPASWESRLRTLAGDNDRVLAQLIPPAYQGETLDERLHAYAADLAYKVRRSYPTEVVGDRVRSGELPLADPRVAPDVAAVLDRAAGSGFVLGHQPLHRFLADADGGLFAGLPADRAAAATEELRTLYRQYQITASDEGIGALQRAGLRSAHAVSALPQQVFLARHGAGFPTLAEASLTWRRAQHISAVALNVVAAAKQLDSIALLPALTYPGELVGPAQTDLVRQFPTLESLFGSLDFCECDHCRSVLSPAAYLVDLLKFLDDAPAGPKTPYDALTERRPDLPHLKLTCENTNTALPYIDVVNEILEFYLSHGGQLAPAAAFDTGDATTEDLLAEPQNLLPAAYEQLRQARYPLTAPFDLWLATVRAFTEHFDTPFWQLLDALRTTDEPHPADAEYGTAAVAYERLGFAPGEIAILTADGPLQTWPALYGYPAGAPQAQWGELAAARTLARRLGITYHELLALLRSRFVNPDLGGDSGDPLVLADGAGDGCGWEDTTLRHASGQAAAPIDFLLLNYLVRVWRRLGWSITDTDEALVTFLPAQPDPRTGATIGPAMAAALLGVARLHALAELLGAGPTARRDLLAFWAPLSDRRYAELFLTGTVQTRDPAFEGNPGSYLTDGSVPLHEHRETVQAALRLTADEIGRILTDAGLDPATAPLTMAAVSLLYRYGLLARLLARSVADVLVVKELSGLDPFTVEFAQTVHAIVDSGLSIMEIDYLVRHRFDPVGPHRSAAGPPLTLVRTLAAEITRIRVEYAVPADPLTFTDAALARALALVLDPPVVAAFLAAWTGTAPLPEGVFDEQLRRQAIPGVGDVGFLDDADLDTLFTPTPDDQAAEAARRERLTGALLPYLQQRLIRRAVVAVVAADQDADPALVEALLTNPILLDDPDSAGQALLAGYVEAAAGGLSIEDGRVTGYLEVLESGGYQVSVRCAAPDTQVVLGFDHLPEPALIATSTAGDLAPATHVDLRAGVPYGFTLEHTAGTEVALWLRSQRLPATPVTRLVTYPRSEVDRLHRLHLLLAKALRLVRVLALTEGEVRHLLAHPGDFAGLDLGALPTRDGEVAADAARALFAQLLRLVGYVRLRGELAAEPADLMALLARARRRAGDDPQQAAEQVLTDVCAAVAAITRREPATVRAAADLLGMSATVDGDQVTAAGFTDERGLARLWRVLSIAARLGVDPAALGGWATPAPDHGVSRDIRDTVRAMYPTAQWRRVAQPIFDRLRQQRRDALVAQVLHVTGYDRVEQLFEHFLVDPGTEPVVLTSRLRLAISSVQTFIQRCLLNLEQDVAPSTIDADYFEWMKRYRVWEANRKIFLWPENWLEPELRDDKTHLFTELEGGLLDSDLDNHAVEAALARYLNGLEDIARLDVRAIYHERRPGGADVLHVVARTATAPHRYFYRTWSHRSWTPWVPVTATVEGDHLAVVMWQGRLHLFWVTLTDGQAEATTEGMAKPGETVAAELTVSQLTGMKPRRRVAVKLYWSCYFQGEWSQPVLAMPDEPVTTVVPNDFSPRHEFIWAHLHANGQVSLSLLGGIDRALRVGSRHAPPEEHDASVPQNPPYLGGETPVSRSGQGRWRGTGPTFAVHVEGEVVTDEGSTPCDLTEPILRHVPGPFRLVLAPPPASLSKSTGKANEADDPFFYLDAEHTFFVEPTWAEFSIPQADQAIVAQLPVWHEFDAPEYWAAREVAPAFPLRDGAGGPVLAAAHLSIPEPADPVTRPDAVVTFGGRPVGRTGGLTGSTRLYRTGPHGASFVARS